jgi:hypothetical protein
MPLLLRPRQSLAKDKFSTYFAGFKSQGYSDPASTRGTSSHGYDASFYFATPFTYMYFIISVYPGALFRSR